MKLGLDLGKLEVWRKGDDNGERGGVVGREWIGSKRRKKNSILRGQQAHSFNKFI